MDTISITSDMRVAIMGYGVTGQSAARYCLSRGATVMVSDSRPADVLSSEFGDYFATNAIEFEGDSHSVDFLGAADLVIVSPGIPVHHPIIEQLKANGVTVAGELAIAAAEFCVPVAAVTGTNGKTTVTALLGHILKSAGKKVFVGGNIGTPLLESLTAEELFDYIVLEVSSFQLEMSGDFSPQIAMLLNISPDHLDWHTGMDEYMAAKKRIFSQQQPSAAAIFPGDNEFDGVFEDVLAAKACTFGKEEGNAARIDGDVLYLNTGTAVERYDLRDTLLAGVTGVRNSAAAVLAARYWGIDRQIIQEALSTFTPPSHRLEKVAEKNGVLFVDDSKATNSGAVEAALSVYTSDVILIAGGRDKGEDYSALANMLVGKVKQVVLLGETAGAIAESIGDNIPVSFAVSMEEAVRIAMAEARAGDTVLLSPACASFDMFESYGHRGRVYASCVNGLPEGEEVMAGGSSHG